MHAKRCKNRAEQKIAVQINCTDCMNSRRKDCVRAYARVHRDNRHNRPDGCNAKKHCVRAYARAISKEAVHGGGAQNTACAHTRACGAARRSAGGKQPRKKMKSGTRWEPPKKCCTVEKMVSKVLKSAVLSHFLATQGKEVVGVIN